MTSTTNLLIGSLVTLVCFGGADTAWSQTSENDVPVAFDRPSYQNLRFAEDWSGLRDLPPAAGGDLWDPIKYVPLSSDGEVWASFGGEARLRFEGWSNFGFSDNDGAFLLSRLKLHSDLHFSRAVRLFVEGKSAWSTDRDLPGGRRSLDVDSLALEQAFVDVSFDLGGESRLTLRPGRQQLLFGKQRLVSPLPWSNSERRWDGVSVILDAESWHIHGFWTQFAPTDKYDFNEADAQTIFSGVYATGPFAATGVHADFYLLVFDRDDPIAFNGTVGDEERFTVGSRLFGKVGDSGFDYDVEGAYQFGEVGEGDVNAWMFGGQLGYRVQYHASAPRVFVGLDYGSGDDSAGGDVETFNQLFPLGHAFLGYADVVGRQNILDVNGGLTFSPIEKLTIGVTGHGFWRASNEDALFNAGGGIVRPGAASDDRWVGFEVDLTLKYQFDRHFSGLLGYSHFEGGDFISESGSDESIDFVYLQLTYTF